MIPIDLTGEQALVTGGGTGIGFAIASALAQAGAGVVIVGRRPDILAAAAARLGPNACALPHDITRLDEAGALFDRIRTETGRLPSVLVNNAGRHMRGPLADHGTDQVATLFEIHVLAALRLTELALQDMVAQGHGTILFISSMSAHIGLCNIPGYSVAKSALEGAVRQLAVEYGPAGIRVNAIAPGWIQTEMFEESMHNNPERRQRVLARTPLGRFGQPSEIGHVAAFLASPLASFVTGSSIKVDGGVAVGF